METLTIILLVCVLISAMYVLYSPQNNDEPKKEETRQPHILMGGILSVGVIWALYISNSIKYLTNKTNENNTYIEQQLKSRDYTKDTINNIKRDMEKYKTNTNNFRKAIHDIHYLRQLFVENNLATSEKVFPVYEFLSKDPPQQLSRARFRNFTGQMMKITDGLKEYEQKTLDDSMQKYNLTEWFKLIKHIAIDRPEIENSDIDYNHHNYEMYKLANAHPSDYPWLTYFIAQQMYIIVKPRGADPPEYIAVRINKELDVANPTIY